VAAPKAPAQVPAAGSKATDPAHIRSDRTGPTSALGAAVVAPIQVAGLAPAPPAPAAVPATSAPAPAPPATPPTPAAQLVSVLNPLSNSAGTHQISLRLHPDYLGTVDATVLVRGNHVVVELAATNPAGQQALSSSLPDLRQQLQAGGQQATVLMSGGGPGAGGGGVLGRGAWTAIQQGPAGSGGPDPLPVAVPLPTPTRTASSVDVRL
jgi:hypothetical protein